MSDFHSANPDDRLIHELMPVLIGIGPNEDLHCYGSCFIAWPHMAITAKHVVEELLKQDPGIAAGQISKCEYWVAQVVWEGNKHNYVIWTIDSIAISAHSDIAIIWLRAFDENSGRYKEWKTVPVTFDPPPLGATVKAFGLHKVCFDGSRIDSEGRFEHVELKFDQSISTGVIRQHYWNGRDKGMYNFPCFEVDAKFEFGMSGGLVISDDSRVCGLVCGSLPAMSPDEPHISYVTMLWPMMAISVDARLVPDSNAAGRYHLQHMSAKGIFTPTGWERVLIHDELDHGGSITIQYLMKA